MTSFNAGGSTSASVRKVAIVLNSLSAKQYLVYEAAEKLSREFSIQVLPTRAAGDDERLASQAVENNVDIIITAGGDGTLHNVVNGILQNRETREKLPAISVFPVGSGNDFARTMQINASVDALKQRLTNSPIQHVDIGKVVFPSGLPEKKRVRYFVNEVSVGLGPEVLQKLSRKSKLLPTGVSYYLATLQAFLSHRPVAVRAVTEQWEWEAPARVLAVANGRYFGHGLCIAPDARTDDGKFSVFLCGDRSAIDFVRYSRKLKAGKKIQIAGISYLDACKIELSSPSFCALEADGEVVGELPVTISPLPGKLSFLK